MTIPVCWRPGKVREVINTDAESVPDAVFRAVHTDWRLFVARPQGTSFQQLHSEAFAERSSQDLLTDFLADRRHTQLAVIGRSGSGKSHLIHWMRLHIPSTPTRLAIVIPKAGTSLRSVLQLIIQHLPAEAQKPFIEELDRTGDATATRPGQKERLLNEIAQAIRDDSMRTAQGEHAEVEEELIRALPHVFQDPHLRERYYLRDDSVISSMVDHVFAAPNTYERTEQRRGFEVEDLPTGGSDFKEASKQARDAMSAILLDEAIYKPLAVEIINRNLNIAISRTLSFSGDRLMQLMISLRKHLKGKGKELVLLIEDFARLQGIDRALLQALLTQGDADVCSVRWAIAVTTGFFESIAETVYTRMTFFVDMDRSSEAKRKAEPGAISHTLVDFSGRYLNAVRLGLSRVIEWHEGGGGADSPPPNACEACNARLDCHSAFGKSVDGYGLYPFTQTALSEMVQRTDDRAGDGFNPRVLQNAVLGSVLETYGAALEQRQFPPRTLLESLGGVKHLSAGDRSKIETALPEESARIVAALEIYGANGQLRNLPEALRLALNLPSLPGQFSDSIIGPDPTPKPLPGGIRSDPEQSALEEWARGGSLPQALATKLRNSVYALIADAIDWDEVGLERSFHTASTAKAFRQTSISFARQETTRGAAPVKILLPGDGASEAELLRTAMALQGLLESSRNGGEWSFSKGMEKLAALLGCLPGWCEDVTRQLLAIHQASNDWHPVTAASELLAIGAALSGRLKHDGTYEEQLSDILATSWPAESGAISQKLSSIYKKLESKRVALRTYVRATTIAGKGGVVGGLFDARDCLKAIQRMRRNGWRMSQVPPSERSVLSDVQDIGDLYKAIANALPEAADEERKARRAWLEEVRGALGPEPKRSLIVESLSMAVKVAQQSGTGKNRTFAAMEEALQEFSGVYFDDAVAAAAVLEKDVDSSELLPHYGRSRLNAIRSTTNLINAASQFLNDIESSFKTLNDQLDASDSLDEDIKTIQSSLTTLSELDSEIGGRDAAN